MASKHEPEVRHERLSAPGIWLHFKSNVHNTPPVTLRVQDIIGFSPWGAGSVYPTTRVYLRGSQFVEVLGDQSEALERALFVSAVKDDKDGEP